MGLFDKLKNILFEDEEVEDLPDYSKEEIKEQPVTRRERNVPSEIMVEKEKEESEPEVVENRFRNVKRDIDVSYDDDDIFKELKKEPSREVKEEKPIVPEVHVEPKREERSVFQTFDEDEFKRQNSRVVNTELRFRGQEISRREVEHTFQELNPARRANSNVSATNPNREVNRDLNRYKIEEPHGKKPFRPSPVISPVYGILDKNYSKDDIVDKKDGIKRERIRPIITHTQDIPSKLNEEVEIEEVDIDSVRNKAYGHIEEERTFEAVVDSTMKDRKREIDSIVNDMRENDLTMEDISREDKTIEDFEDISAILEETPEEVSTVEVQPVEEVSEDIELPTFNIGDLNSNVIQETETIPETMETTNNIEDEIDIEIDDIPEVKEYHEEEDMFDKSHILDEMEKTSTLQILDDIEKELNSIKPINRFEEDDEEYVELDEKARLDRSDTLENDLFNLIDSMYEEGEEDDDNDNA